MIVVPTVLAKLKATSFRAAPERWRYMEEKYKQT